MDTYTSLTIRGIHAREVHLIPQRPVETANGLS